MQHWHRPTCHWWFANGLGASREDPHGPRNVLNSLLAPILECIGEPIADMVANGARDADTPRLREPLQPRGDIHPIAENVIALGNHVAEVDPDPELDPLL